MEKINTPCFDNVPPGGRLVCVCGYDPAKPWETKGWCYTQQRINAPLQKPSEAEIALMEYRDRLVRKIKYACANLPALEHALVDIIYRA